MLPILYMGNSADIFGVKKHVMQQVDMVDIELMCMEAMTLLPMECIPCITKDTWMQSLLLNI